MVMLRALKLRPQLYARPLAARTFSLDLRWSRAGLCSQREEELGFWGKVTGKAHDKRHRHV